VDQLVQEKWGVIEVKRETFLGNSFGRSFGALQKPVPGCDACKGSHKRGSGILNSATNSVKK